MPDFSLTLRNDQSGKQVAWTMVSGDDPEEVAEQVIAVAQEFLDEENDWLLGVCDE